MFAYIKGELIQAAVGSVVIEAVGVGYKIFTPASVFHKLPSLGDKVVLHTSFVVREQAQTLYGFLTMQERDFFEALMGVTGIGPKSALALIGHMTLMELQQAISQGNIAVLSKAPGIGKKSAERLIVEMRDKVAAHSFSPADLAVHSFCDPRTQSVNDAMSALINLGYNHATAQKAMKRTLSDLPESSDLPVLISTALKHI